MAGTPTWPSMTEGQWNLVASNVTTGYIHQLKSQFKVHVTTVATGAAAPLDAILAKSPEIFTDGNSEKIDSSTAIDIYLWIENADTSTDITATNSIQVNAS